MKGGHGRARLMLSPSGAEEGRGFGEDLIFILSVLICIRFRIIHC